MWPKKPRPRGGGSRNRKRGSKTGYDERLRRELADEKARVRKEERDADREERRAAAAEAKEVRDHEYRMLLLQMQKGSAGN